MGRVFDRANARSRARQARKDAVLNADPSTIKRLPPGGTGWSSARKRFEQGFNAALAKQIADKPNDPIYMKGYNQGRRIDYARNQVDKPQSKYDRIFAERRAAQPTDDQVKAELQARAAADQQRKVLRQQSGIFDALRG